MVHKIIGDNMEILIVVLRAMFFYIFLLVIYKIMGKREVGQLGIIDLSVSLLISQIVAFALENNKQNIMLSIAPILTLVALEVLFTYLTLKMPKLNNIMHEKPSVIIKEGKLMFKEMIKQRYALDELLTELRENSVRSIEEVEYAILEGDGNLSIFQYDENKKKSPYPMPLILDGKINRSTLETLNKDDKWISQILEKNNVELNNVFYAFYGSSTVYIIKKSEIKNTI